MTDYQTRRLDAVAKKLYEQKIEWNDDHWDNWDKETDSLKLHFREGASELLEAADAIPPDNELPGDAASQTKPVSVGCAATREDAGAASLDSAFTRQQFQDALEHMKLYGSSSKITEVIISALQQCAKGCGDGLHDQKIMQLLEKSLREFDLDQPDTDFQVGYLSALQDLWTEVMGQKWIATHRTQKGD